MDQRTIVIERTILVSLVKTNDVYKWQPLKPKLPLCFFIASHKIRNNIDVYVYAREDWHGLMSVIYLWTAYNLTQLSLQLCMHCYIGGTVGLEIESLLGKRLSVWPHLIMARVVDWCRLVVTCQNTSNWLDWQGNHLNLIYWNPFLLSHAHPWSTIESWDWS